MAEPTTPNSSSRPQRRIRSIVRMAEGGGRAQFDKEAVKDIFFIVALPLLAVIAAFWFATRFIKPAPPNTFVMTTGADGGAYHLFANRYRAILAREKINIALEPSAGSLENLQRLQNAN